MSTKEQYDDIPVGMKAEEAGDGWAETEWIRGRKKRWQNVGEKFWRVPKDVAKHRYGICKQCEEFIGFTSQCQLCFCAMGIKVWFAGFSCPKQKWSTVDPPSKKSD